MGRFNKFLYYMHNGRPDRLFEFYCLVQFNGNLSFQISQRNDTRADWIEQNLYRRHLGSAFYSNEWK